MNAPGADEPKAVAICCTAGGGPTRPTGMSCGFGSRIAVPISPTKAKSSSRLPTTGGASFSIRPRPLDRFGVCVLSNAPWSAIAVPPLVIQRLLNSTHVELWLSRLEEPSPQQAVRLVEQTFSD